MNLTKSLLLRVLRMLEKCFLAVDCGGTKISSAILNSAGSILFKQSNKLNGAGGKAVLNLIIAQINSLIKESNKINLSPLSCGLCIPGISYHNSGKVWAPNIPGWEEFPLKDELNKALKNQIKISIDSDRACAILAETWQGKAQKSKNAIFVAVGTGIGAGILVDGKILRGHGDIAGATGWMALDRPYDNKYNACGNFEYYASGNGIARTAKELLARTIDYEGELNNIESLRSEDVFTAYDHNDPIAIKTFNICIELWGMALANYVSLFNPEIVIFGGGVFGPAKRFLQDIVNEAKKWAQPLSMMQVRVDVTDLTENAILIGAGKLAMINA